MHIRDTICNRLWVVKIVIVIVIIFCCSARQGQEQG
jgi:hypothetical protein